MVLYINVMNKSNLLEAIVKTRNINHSCLYFFVCVCVGVCMRYLCFVRVVSGVCVCEKQKSWEITICDLGDLRGAGLSHPVCCSCFTTLRQSREAENLSPHTPAT